MPEAVGILPFNDPYSVIRRNKKSKKDKIEENDETISAQG